VDPEISAAVTFQTYVVVVGSDDGFPADFRSQRANQHPANLFRNRSSGGVGVTPGAGGIMKIFSALVGIGIEAPKSVAYRFRS
jgi:hypothetical protein